MSTIYRHTTRMGRSENFISEDYRNDINKKIGFAKWVAKKRIIGEWKNAEHVFQLFRGEQKFGKPQTMTGREAVLKNRAYEKKFMSDYDKDKNARMWRLKIVKAEEGGS